MNAIGGLLTAGHRTNDEACAIGRIATDEDVFWVFWVFWLQESHSQQNKFGFNDFRFAGLDHKGTATSRVGLPVDGLDANGGDVVRSSIFPDGKTVGHSGGGEEFKGVDVPAAGASFLVR